MPTNWPTRSATAFPSVGGSGARFASRRSDDTDRQLSGGGCMTFTVVIPARMASTRLPNKPLADLGGKPMVVRTAERAAQACAERVIVATDHADIAAAAARTVSTHK